MRLPYMYECEFIPTAPYDFDLVLAQLKAAPSAVLEAIDTHARTYRRAFLIGDRPLLLTLQAVGTTESPRLRLAIRSEGEIDSHLQDAARRLVDHLFMLRADPGPVMALCAAEPVLNALAERYYGWRPVMIATPFEALIWAILGQQINIAFAAKLKRRLIDLCASELQDGAQRYPLMPSPAQVAALAPAALHALQFSRKKSEYLLQLATHVEAGALDLEALRSMEVSAAIDHLTQRKGVGRWTAEYVLMRGYGRLSVMPAGDLGLRAAIGGAYGMERKATEEEVRQFAQRWGEWKGWMALYWWLSLQEPEDDE